MYSQFFIQHPEVQPLLNYDPPNRPLFVQLVGQVIGQKIRFTTASQIRGKLYTKLGGDQFTPQNIIDLGETELTCLGLLDFQVQTILRVAQYFIEHLLSENIHGEAITTSIQQLQSIKGIGPWTINTLLIVYYNTHIFPDGDKVLLRWLKRNYPNTHPKDVFQSWYPYGGYICKAIWKYES